MRHALFDRSRKRYKIDTTGGHEHRIHVGGTADVKNAQFYFCRGRKCRNGQHADRIREKSLFITFDFIGLKILPTGRKIKLFCKNFGED